MSAFAPACARAGLWNYLTVIASEDVGLGYPMMPVLIDRLRKQYYDKYFIDNGKNDNFLTHAVAQLCQCKKSRIVDDLTTVIKWEIEHSDTPREIPPYAIDHKTERGRKLGRWNVWYTEGCKLNNEIDIPNWWAERANKIRRRARAS